MKLIRQLLCNHAYEPVLKEVHERHIFEFQKEFGYFVLKDVKADSEVVIKLCNKCGKHKFELFILPDHEDDQVSIGDELI